ncbi:hypothetical protein TNIN_473521 [Trichonephila inaurata madagascariensis]|uniref:Uncharacterized protein n=1 Tax=Trichonephila inaurata madagascariensis TaxID=2747483 RepID=A0A8X7CRT5_9ARAC|nr:hypothetical protein TNIN_473521 [Trichonephila inaurata madagascariensis]
MTQRRRRALDTRMLRAKDEGGTDPKIALIIAHPPFGPLAPYIILTELVTSVGMVKRFCLPEPSQVQNELLFELISEREKIVYDYFWDGLILSDSLPPGGKRVEEFVQELYDISYEKKGDVIVCLKCIRCINTQWPSQFNLWGSFSSHLNQRVSVVNVWVSTL